MDKPTLRELLKNPANVVLVLIFFTSIIVGSLFMFRVFYHENDNSEVAMKEIDDNLSYYLSVDTTDESGNPSKNIVLVLSDNNKFNLILSNEKKYGYSGLYVKKDNIIYLYTDKFYSSEVKAEFKEFIITIENDDLVLNSSINNTSNYRLKKSNLSDIKSKGFNNVNINTSQINYSYMDSDNENIYNSIYSLTSPYNVIKFIDRIGNHIVLQAEGNVVRDSSIYSGNAIYRRYINPYYILEFILPNISEDNYNANTINEYVRNIFKTEINFNNLGNIKYNGKVYNYENDAYHKINDNTENLNNSYIKRVYNYEIIDNKLYVYEIAVGYECSGGTCKFYPFTEINQDERNYYDFTASSIDIINVLNNKDKINYFKWTFEIDENSNYIFETLEFI
ncbi:MAG: hypothetical protein J5634_02780 [Bacilli bacterium]|nr:hypothetical protein [Bacilli bacterium]